MSYRDILVQIGDRDAAGPAATTAAELAARWSAHLTGTFLHTPFPIEYFAAEPFVGLSVFVYPEVIEQHEKAMTKASEDARMRFEAAAGDAGVVSDWTVTEGGVPEHMIDAMRRTDLTVLPRELPARVKAFGVKTEDLAMGAGGPVLILPETGASRSLGRRIVIAWNGGREAARALRDAEPFLAEAEKVYVVVVAPRTDNAPESLLQRHLERHGCKVELVIDRSEDAAAAQVLKDQIGRLNADLVVMGLYGHRRAREMILGGVSRDLLRASPVPLLVSH